MNNAKFIRVLGYIVYAALWLPITLLHVTVTPVVCLGLCVRSGRSVKSNMKQLLRQLRDDFVHDVRFIQTGEW